MDRLNEGGKDLGDWALSVGGGGCGLRPRSGRRFSFCHWPNRGLVAVWGNPAFGHDSFVLADLLRE
jgi:hypothetical protein